MTNKLIFSFIKILIFQFIIQKLSNKVSILSLYIYKAIGSPVLECATSAFSNFKVPCKGSNGRSVHQIFKRGQICQEWYSISNMIDGEGDIAK